MKKLNFDQTLELLGDDRAVCASKVQTRALSRVVWVAEWHIPGCMSESRCISTSKADAIRASLSMAESENGAPWGMKAALLRDGYFESKSPLFGRCINTVTRGTLAKYI